MTMKLWPFTKSSDRKPLKAGMPVMVVRGKYDAAQTTPDNRRHWANADGLSPNAAINPAVRRTLRNRARYEVANNSYAKGIVLTLANDTVGTGPRLQLLTPDSKANDRVERAFEQWALAVDLPEKLRTMRMARAESGEAFAMLTSNPRITFTEYEDEYDDKKHSKVKAKAGAKMLVIDGIGKVFTDANDTTPGFLDAEVTVTPAAGGHEWLKKTVQPGGAVDNKLLLEHNDWDVENVEKSDPVPGNLVGGNGVEVVDEQPEREPYVEYQEFRDHYDAKKHSLLSPQVESEQPVKKFIKLPGKVFTDADDTTPGFLNDEIIVDPPNGDPSWLEKSVEPGGAADNKLLVEHKDWDSARVEDTVHSLMSWEDNGGGLYLDISQPSEGWAWINIEVWRHTRDRKGHCDLISRQPDPVPLDPIYLKWVAVPMGTNVGDMLYWDGDKWVTLAAPSGGDFVLMSSGAAPYWQQVQEFECPGTSGGS